MEPSESREDRLVRVIQKLESKVRAIWEEKKTLAERLELAMLDKELAEERYMALESALQSESEAKAALNSRITELEELQALSIELEESYVAQKEELSQVIRELKAALATASEKAQRDAQVAEERIQELQASETGAQALETLRQELASAKLQLAASELDLAVQKSGMPHALEAVFAKDAPGVVHLLPFIDYYNLSDVLREAFDSFRVGDIPAKKFAEAIENAIREAGRDERSYQLNWKAVIKLLKAVGGPSEHLRAVLMRAEREEATSGIKKLLQRLMVDVDMTTVTNLETELEQSQLQQIESQAKTESNSDFLEKISSANQEVESLKLRARFLESKLSQAKELAAEIDRLKAWQNEARIREKHLTSLLAESEETKKQKEFEIAKLKRAELPTTLDAAIVQQKLKGMEVALQWFSRRQRQRVALDPLETTVPHRVSVLTGNPRVSALRKAVLDFSLVQVEENGKERPLARKAARTALDQYERLFLLGCSV